MTIISASIREKRRDRRRAIVLTLEYDGQDFVVADASLGGIVIEGGCRAFPIGSDVVASLKTSEEGAGEGQEVSLNVVRNDPRARRVGFQFAGLNDASFTTLERLLTGRRKP